MQAFTFGFLGYCLTLQGKKLPYRFLSGRDTDNSFLPDRKDDFLKIMVYCPVGH